MDIVRIPVAVAGRAPGGRTNAYVVDGLLVDPPARTDELDRAVERAGVDHLAVTHTHPDHVGAVAAYAKATDATVWAHDGYERRFQDATGVAPDRLFREGTAIGPATVVETPGHAPDHVAFAFDHAAVVGDLAVAEGSVFVGGDDGDLRAYLVSLRRLLALDFETLYPGHGPVIDTPRKSLLHLLRHRRDREQRILVAVRSGARTPAAIVDRAYENDLEGLRDLATLTVKAHLTKLDVEGTLEWDGRRAVAR